MSFEEIKISLDQKVIEYKGQKYSFTENKACRYCDMKNKGVCKLVPCSNFEEPKRKDNIECGSFNII